MIAAKRFPFVPIVFLALAGPAGAAPPATAPTLFTTLTMRDRDQAMAYLIWSVRSLHDGNRRHAVEMIEPADPNFGYAIATLIAIRADADAPLRDSVDQTLQLIKEIVQIPPAARSALARDAESLCSPLPVYRDQAVDRLLSLTEPPDAEDVKAILPALLAGALHSDDARARSTATRLMKAWAPHSAETAAALQHAIIDPDLSIREAAFRAANRPDAAERVRMLPHVEDLFADDPPMREVAAQVLAQSNLDSEPWMTTLLEAVRTRDFATREAMAAAMRAAYAAGQPALPTLREQAANPNAPPDDPARAYARIALRKVEARIKATTGPQP